MQMRSRRRVATASADEEAVVEDVVVREGGAFREARRARGVLDVDGVVEIELGLPLTKRTIEARMPALEELIPAHHRAGPVAEQHGGAHGGYRRDDRVERLEIAGPAEPVRRDEQRDPGLTERVRQFLTPVRRVHGDENGSDLGRGVLDDHPFDAVARPDADAVALLHALRQQRTGGAFDQRMECLVGEVRVLVPAHDRECVGRRGDHPVELRANRPPDERYLRNA